MWIFVRKVYFQSSDADSRVTGPKSIRLLEKRAKNGKTCD